jgi:serine/threonine protein kinase
MRADQGPPVTGTWGSLRLIQKVGQGAFGEVYRAFDTTLEREVALKLLLPRGQDPESEAQALLREARALARVRHPNVVPVYGVATHDRRVGFWSDFVHGKTLLARKVLLGRGKQPSSALTCAKLSAPSTPPGFYTATSRPET